MTLRMRVGKLEAASRGLASQPCRWHGGVVIFPDSFPPGTGRQQARAMCDAPGRCTGRVGLLIDIGDDEDGEA